MLFHGHFISFFGTLAEVTHSFEGEHIISLQLTLILQSPFFCPRGSVEVFQTYNQ